MMYLIGAADQLKLASIEDGRSDICWKGIGNYGMILANFKSYIAANLTREQRPGAKLVHEALRFAHLSCE